jgi:GT2 family glycosyltransferase
MIAIAIITNDRAHLLRDCVDKVLARTTELVTEIVIWNNGSVDETREYLDTLDDPRIRIVHHPENIGTNGYARAVAMTSAPYIIELDDDMIDAPDAWDRTMLEAYEKLPTIGFLAAHLVDNPHDTAARVMYHERPEAYRDETLNGVALIRGPVGGGCALTDRELYERVGGFQVRDEVFFLEDAAYIGDIAKLGYESAYLRDVKFTHAGGSYYAKESPAKHAYWQKYWKKQIRMNRIKKTLLLVPGVRPLNARHGWFRLAEIPDFKPGDWS